MNDVLEQLEEAAGAPDDDRYLLIERLARGGQGEVWLAHKLGLDGRPVREVVLKTVIPGGDADDVARRRAMFLREAAVAARLEHKNIVRVTDWGADLFGSELFLEMERIRGIDLRALLARRGVPLDPDRPWGALPAQDVAWIGREIAAGLHYAHTHALTGEDDTRAGVAHGDLSPDNIMGDVLGDVRLADFGITRPLGLDGQAEQTETRAGKLPYLAPEATRGEIGVRSDIYSLGVTLTVLLTGRHVFTASDSASDHVLLDKIRRGVRPTVAALAPDAPPALQDLLERMMQVDPSRRPAIAGALVEPFERIALALGGRLSAAQAAFAGRVREHHVEGRRTEKASAPPSSVPTKSTTRRRISPATQLDASDEGSNSARNERRSTEHPMFEEPDTEAAPISFQPGAYVGPWKIVRKLGAGGMGATFVAQREDITKRACLKVIRRELATDPAYRAQFLDEAKAAAQASHPSVVSLIDYGEHQSGELWAAYDLVDGVDLLALMRKLGGKLDADLLALIVLDIASGLLHLHTPTHRRGAIIHRDVSINNVMVSYNGHAILIDLGIAKLLMQDGRAVTQARGKPGYMAPEIGREPITPAVDQWSLGVLIYLLLAAQKPFPRGYSGQPPAPLRELAPSVDPRWQPIVDRLLSPDPRDRYPSLDGMMEELTPLVPGPTRRLELGRLLLKRAPAPSAPWVSAQPADAAKPPKVDTTDPGAHAASAPAAAASPPPETSAPSAAPERAPAPAPASGFIGALRPGDTFGAWTIDAKLGEGGMAVVYRARRTSSLGTQTAALKLIRPAHADSPDFREKFAAEAKTALRLNHQNIVTVLDAGEVDGVYYLAMELIDGCDLSAMLDRLTERGVLDHRRLPPRLVAAIGYHMARGVAYAHARGVLHRDLTTNNAMVTVDGAVKWTDWGVAKPLDARGVAARTAHMVGKPYYMSKEQFQGHELDARADLFSIGATLYELLAGAPPYAIQGNPREAIDMVIFRVFNDHRPRVLEIAPGAPPELAEALEKLLQVEKQNRLGSADELMAALEPIVEVRVTRELAQLVQAALDESYPAPDFAHTGPLPELSPSSGQREPSGAAPRTPVTEPLSPASGPAPQAAASPSAPEQLEPSPRSRPLLWLALGAVVMALALVSGAAAFLLAGDPDQDGVSPDDERARKPTQVTPAPEPAEAEDPNNAPESPETTAEAPATTEAEGSEPPDLEARTEDDESASTEPEATDEAVDEAPPRREARAVARGSVRVIAVPEGQILVDGRVVGRSPQTVTLAPGAHSIVARYSDGSTAHQQVRVRAGQTARVLLEQP